jgi:ABC-type multidrug transport system ATPase subunit
MAETQIHLRISHLYKEYVSNKPVLKDINLEVKASGLVAIIGPSGTGKSTLIRCINRLVEPTKGSIDFYGKDIERILKLVDIRGVLNNETSTYKVNIHYKKYLLFHYRQSAYRHRLILPNNKPEYQ